MIEDNPSEDNRSKRKSSASNVIRSTLLDLLAGSIAGGVGCAAGHPIDVVKMRLQSPVVPTASRNAFQCSKHMWQNEGARSFWRGLQAPLLGVAAYQAVLFASFNGALQLIDDGVGSSSIKTQFLAGTFSGMCSTLVTTPCDLVKTLMAMQTGAKHESRFRNSIHCALEVWRSGGLRGLYHGWTITLIRDIPSSALYFISYDESKKMMDSFFKFYEDESTEKERLLKEKKQGYKTPGLSEMIAGGTAGAITWFSILPFDVVKTVIQAGAMGNRPESENKIRPVFSRIWNESGMRGFVRGVGPLVSRAFWVNAVTFYAYEWLKIAFGLTHLGVK
eukprot:g1581.t1